MASVSYGTTRARLKLQVGEDDWKQHFVGDNHQRYAETGSDAQFLDDGDVDKHDHHEAQSIGQQRHGAWHRQFTNGTLCRGPRVGPGKHILLPRVSHLHRMGNTDGENHERH
ncbi:hypothetical protein D3C80_1613320 [compost metagenome]